MCLDVSSSRAWHRPTRRLAAGQTQLGVVASFSELVNVNVNGEADPVAFAQLGHTSITELLVPADSPIQTLEDFRGVDRDQGDLPPDITAMLATAGVNPGDYTSCCSRATTRSPLLARHRRPARLQVNEPDTLDKAGIEYRVRSARLRHPSSFAVYMTTRSFYEAHPTVVEDFVQGRPAATSGHRRAPARRPRLRPDRRRHQPVLPGQGHETYRWSVETADGQNIRPEGFVVGQIDIDSRAEVASHVSLGLFDETAWEDMVTRSRWCCGCTTTPVS